MDRRKANAVAWTMRQVNREATWPEVVAGLQKRGLSRDEVNEILVEVEHCHTHHVVLKGSGHA
jgi:hypothetical protein